MLPLLLLGLLLGLPLPWNNQAPVDSTWIDVQLQAPTSRQAEIQQPEPQFEPEPELEPEPIKETKPESEPRQNPEPNLQETPQAVTPQPIRLPPPAKSPVKPSTQPEPSTKQPTATDVMRMMSQPPRVELSDEFMPRLGPAKDFYIPEQEIMDWFADIPYLDESVDQPKLTMRFYPEGIEGHVEKFFDKITISKTFTTKYGTKIHCAVIGVIAACSWK